MHRDPIVVIGGFGSDWRDYQELARLLAYRNPPPHPEGGTNTRLWRASVYPSTSGHGNARAIATIFGGISAGGDWRGQHILAEAIRDEAIQIHADGEDAVLGRPNRFGLGFQLTNPGIRPLGPGQRSFGHYGNGAILGFGDPDGRIASSLAYLRDLFGYLASTGIKMYRMSSDLAPYAAHPNMPQFHNQVAECADELAEMGALARRIGLRLSFHAVAATVLNSPDPSVAANAAADLTVLAAILNCLETPWKLSQQSKAPEQQQGAPQPEP